MALTNKERKRCSHSRDRGYYQGDAGMKKAIILMNHMKSSAANVVEFDEGFLDRAAAIAYINQFRVTPYLDEGERNDYGDYPTYSKVFAKGSPLEWMNPLSESEMQGQLSRLGHGIVEIEEQLVPRWVRVS
jgi:hypothetical protein